MSSESSQTTVTVCKDGLSTIDSVSVDPPVTPCVGGGPRQERHIQYRCRLEGNRVRSREINRMKKEREWENEELLGHRERGTKGGWVSQSLPSLSRSLRSETALWRESAEGERSCTFTKPSIKPSSSRPSCSWHPDGTQAWTTSSWLFWGARGPGNQVRTSNTSHIQRTNYCFLMFSFTTQKVKISLCKC